MTRPHNVAYWINKHGQKVKMTEMSDIYIKNTLEKIEADMANRFIPRPIEAYALMFNKGKKWALKTTRKYYIARFKALKKVAATRGI